MATSDPDSGALRSLAERAALADRAAFAELHRRLDRPLQALFSRRGADPGLVDELVQQTWTRLWEALHAGRYRPQAAAITTYTYAIAHNVWLQRFRGRPASGSDASPDAADSTDFTEEIAAAELLEALRGCMRASAGLTADERLLVEAFADGASERELAASLGVAASTVNARKKAAFAKLRQCLASKGFTVAEQLGGEPEQ